MKKQKNIWEFYTNGVKHIIKAKMGSTSREPIEIFVDDQNIAIVKVSNPGMIPQMEYEFMCGDEPIRMVLHGAIIDMVVRGKFIDHKNNYTKQKELPQWFHILTICLSLASILEFWLFSSLFGNLMTYSLALFWIFVSIVSIANYSTNPFYTKRKKFILSALFCISSWMVTFVIGLVM